MSKVFEVAADAETREAEGEDPGEITFEIKDLVGPDDEPTTTECRAYFPGSGQLAMLMASAGRFASLEQNVAGVIDFFVSVCDDDSQAYIVDRLLDRKDPFGMREVRNIMDWMAEEWGGRPTGSRSSSAKSQRSTGRSSTRRTPART